MTNTVKNAEKMLEKITEQVRTLLGEHLVSITVFGSAADGQLRRSSDVNVLLELRRFEFSAIDQLREAVRVAHAAVRLQVMVVLSSELASTSELFAVKFQDILDRHRVLYGPDPFATTRVSREATVRQLRQMVLNQLLKIRERYLLVSLREEQLIPLIADSAGPIRVAASIFSKLELSAADATHSKDVIHPKRALEKYVSTLAPRQNHPWTGILENLSTARETLTLPPGLAIETFRALHELLLDMHKRAESLTIQEQTP